MAIVAMIRTLASRDDLDRMHAKCMADPKWRATYARESAKMDAWLHLCDMRRELGLTKQQAAAKIGITLARMTRVEEAGYDYCSLNKLRKYASALARPSLGESSDPR